MNLLNNLPIGVSRLIIINIAIFLLQIIFGESSNFFIENNFSLNYFNVLYKYQFWQIFSYFFLHGSWLHLFFNMLALLFIGIEIERNWGTKSFLFYYLISGIGAGIFILFIEFVKKSFIDSIFLPTYTLGASGAIFSLLLAYSLMFKEKTVTILVFFVLPVSIKAKYLLVLSLVLTFFFPLLLGSSSNISHAGHIGGVVSGLFVIAFSSKYSSFGYVNIALKETIKNIFSFITLNKSTRGNLKLLTRKRNTINDLNENNMTPQEIENKIDELLAIISQKGLRGLNQEEKLFLTRVSFDYEHKFPNQ